MNEIKYFLISNDDGECTIRIKTQEELERELDAGHYGESPNFIPEPWPDPELWRDGEILLIRGQVVVPMPKKVTTRWRV